MVKEDFITDITVDLKSDRLNDDVVLFMSCTLQELLVVIGFSLVLGMFLGVILMKLMVNSFVWGLPVGIFLFFMIFFILVFRFSKLKRDKPSGYYKQYLLIRLSELGFFKLPFVMRTGRWSTQRKQKTHKKNK